MRTVLFGSAALVMAASISAQEFVGLTFNCSAGFATRGSLSAAAGAGELMLRIEASEIAGFCPGPTAGSRAVSSIRLVVQDQDALTTPESFGLVLYPEDPANAGFPLRSAGVTAATALPGPAAPASGTIAAVSLTVNFGTPLLLPGNGDLFVAAALPAAPAWSTDGLSLQGYFGQNVAGFTTFDLPGARQMTPGTTAALSYALTYTAATGLMNYNSSRCLLIDLAGTRSNGGVVGAVTNQASWPLSNTAPGSASPFSAHHPDAVAPPRNVGRADNISYTLFDSVRAPGTAIFFLVDLGSFAPEVPMAQLIPGSTGMACLNLATVRSVGLDLTAGGMASRVLTVPTAARRAISGLPLLQQAIALDFSTGTAHAGPCGAQLF